jgi:hypothetical protein
MARAGGGGNALEDVRRQINQQKQTLHLTSTFTPLRTAVLNFQVPSSQIITEIPTEILGFAMPNMEVSHLFNILQGGVRNINLLCVNNVGEEVLICLPPVLGCLGWHWEKWGWESVG